MRMAKRVAVRAAYDIYRLGAYAVQAPRAWRERTPRILGDETIRPAIGDRFAIVVKYALIGVTEDFLDLLAALRAQQVNIIVVCNGDMDAEGMALLRQAAHRIILRPNAGRDFGAYRAATLRLAAEGLSPSRILYFNDSVIYLRGAGLDGMVAAMADSAFDVVGATENHQGDHHVGTFAFSFSGRVFRDAKVLAFWRRYRTFELRPHVIREGEAGLARCVKQCGYRIDVIFSAARLAARLDTLSFPELLGLLRYVPIGALRGFAVRDYLRGARDTGRMLAPEHAPWMPARWAPSGPPDAVRHERAAIAERMRRDALTGVMIGAILDGSQVHLGFGLLHRVLDLPLVKRDLLFRGVLLDHDCARILDRLPEDRRNAVLRELVNRGRPVGIGAVRRFLLHNGLI